MARKTLYNTLQCTVYQRKAFSRPRSSLAKRAAHKLFVASHRRPDWNSHRGLKQTSISVTSETDL